jgi:hypothetical protein
MSKILVAHAVDCPGWTPAGQWQALSSSLFLNIGDRYWVLGQPERCTCPSQAEMRAR